MRELEMTEIELISGGSGDDHQSRGVFFEIVIGVGGVVSWESGHGWDWSPRMGLGAGAGYHQGPDTRDFIADAHADHTWGLRGVGFSGNSQDGFGGGASIGGTGSWGDRASETPWY